jgi:type IX secretion system PorP/SprF family membrane protein
MQLQKILLFCFVIFSCLTIKAQDVHYSYFEMSPLTFNPAQTGAFSGTLRLSGHFRGQWLGSGNYKTPAFSVDAPVIQGFRDNDWIGGGINFYSDTAGPAGLKTTGGGLNAAYHFGFDKNYSQVFSIGIKYGRISRSVNNFQELQVRNDDLTDIIDFRADASSVISAFNPNAELGFDGGAAADYGIGFLYKNTPDKKSSYEMGFSVDHITSPNASFAQQNRGQGGNNPMLPEGCDIDPTAPECRLGTFETQENRNIRFTGTAGMTNYINDKFRLSPGAMIQFTQQGFEAQAHAIAGYLINPEKGVVLNGGLGVRAIGLADLQLFFGVEMKDIKVGAAFDLGVLGFQQAPGFQNAFEIGAQYIIKIYKDPDVDPVIFCPRF